MTYNAIFTVDGAQYEVVPTKVGEQIVAPKDPAKEGYVFKGWDKEVGKMGVEDITFAAQFEEASGVAYTVEVYTMDVNGNYGAAGCALGSQTYKACRCQDAPRCGYQDVHHRLRRCFQV